MTRKSITRVASTAAFVTAIIGVIVSTAGVSSASSTAPVVNGQVALQAAQQAFDQLPATPNSAWGIDQAAGQVLLTISDAAPTAGVRRLLGTAAQFGDRVLVRHTHGVLSEQVLGGDQIDNGQISCSAGFNVVRDDEDYVVTAGHCTQNRTTWKGVGPSVASNFPGTDFGLVRNETEDGPGLVDRFDGTVQPITGVGTAAVGEKVCASGEATGVTCGQVTAVDQTVDYGDGDVVHGLIATNVHTDHGDSGGPLFDGTTGLGVVSGGDGQTDYFQPLGPIMSTYGLDLAY